MRGVLLSAMACQCFAATSSTARATSDTTENKLVVLAKPELMTCALLLGMQTSAHQRGEA